MKSFAQITFGRFYPADSIMHRLDVRFKILIIMLYSTITISLTSLFGFAAAALILLVLIGQSRVPVLWVLRSARPLLYIFILTLLVHTLFADPGAVQSPAIKFWILNINFGGFLKGLFVDLRLFLLICGASLLTLTSKATELNLGFEHLLSPLKWIKVPVAEIAFMMTIALSFIPVLLSDSEKVMKAQMARGASFDTGGFIERARNLMPLVIPLLVKVFKTANDLSYAMESRCFVPGAKRTRWRVLKTGTQDVSFFVAAVASLVVLYLLDTRFGIYQVL